VAGPAPIGPEVNQDGNAGGLDNLVEQGGVDLQRLVYWRQRSLARAASAGVGEVVCAYSVLLAAVLTGSDRWHRELLLGDG
jgi:hypothetical protein